MHANAGGPSPGRRAFLVRAAAAALAVLLAPLARLVPGRGAPAPTGGREARYYRRVP